MDRAFPSCGVALKMLYIVPRRDSGNQRDRLMVPGGEPMLCAQPLRPHSTTNSSITVTEPTASVPCKSPSAPSSKFIRADTPMPAAIKRRMLQ